MGWAYRNSDVFYYFSFLSLVFAKSLGFYSGNTEYRIIMVFSMLCLGIKLVLTKYTVKEIVVMAAIALYAVFIYLKLSLIHISMEFKEKLERRLGLEVVMWDERLTTVAADRTMMEAGVRRENRKEYVDMLAAQFILQGYLDLSLRHIL